jgi:hypothetical protein
VGSSEATITLANTLPSDVAIYAPAAHRAILEPYLVWATPGQRGFGEQQPLSDVPTTGVLGTSLSPKKGARTPKADPSEASKAAELRGILDGLHSVDGRCTTLLVSSFSIACRSIDFLARTNCAGKMYLSYLSTHFLLRSSLVY